MTHQLAGDDSFTNLGDGPEHPIAGGTNHCMATIEGSPAAWPSTHPISLRSQHGTLDRDNRS